MSSEGSIPERVAKIEGEVTDLKVDVATIKSHVTNHIPHILSEHTIILKSLEDRLKPVETIHIKTIGVSQILSIILKVVLSLAILSWTTVQIVYFFMQHM